MSLVPFPQGNYPQILWLLSPTFTMSLNNTFTWILYHLSVRHWFMFCCGRCVLSSPPIVCPGVNNRLVFHLPAFLPTNVYRFLIRSLSWLLFRTTGYSFLGLLLIALLDWIPCFLDPVCSSFLFYICYLNKRCVGGITCEVLGVSKCLDHLAGNRLLDWKWFSCKILKVLRRMKGDLVCKALCQCSHIEMRDSLLYYIGILPVVHTTFYWAYLNTCFIFSRKLRNVKV